MDPEEAIKRVSLDDNKLGFNTECQFYKLKQILHGPRRVIPKCPGQFYTPLQTISFALNLFFDKMKKPPHHAIVMTNDLNFKKLVIYFEKSCLTVAECLMHCNEFCELSKSDRALLFNHFWPFFLVIERIYFSIATFGAEDPRTLIFYDDYQVCGDQFGKFSNPEMTMEKRNQLFELFNPANKYLLNLIYLPMKELKLTNLTEFSYMVGHYLWSLDDIIGVSNEAKALARSVMLSLNNDIHHYYTFTLKETNYAHRISMLMKLNARTNTYCRQKKEIRITSQFFDIFDGSKLYDEKLCIDNPTLIYLRE
uniref:NR LBD domain-containing protein n=1 Tax=Rhabditophanes sp. KR3021 TaxID=114890 RepID=A0AC35UAF8_9BILA